jgi:hypothetical protein
MSATAPKTVAASKTKAKTAVAAPAVPAPAPAPAVPAPAPAVAEAKAPRAKKAAPVTTDVSTPAPAPAADAAASSEEDELTGALQKSIDELHTLLKNQREAVSSTLAALKTLEGHAKRVMRKVQRRSKRGKTPAEGSKPCHFNVPGEVAPELLAFLQLPKESLISRTDVTKGVMNYCKANSLLDGKTVNPDAALTKLLRLKEGTVVTILNLQTHLKHLYVKKVKPTTA